MSDRSFFFAGGGTGGHIYPALAVAERIIEFAPAAEVSFLCSGRSIDSRILGPSGFDYTALPMTGFSFRPSKLADSFSSFVKSYRIARAAIAQSENPMVIGIGGFASGPTCSAAHKLGAAIALLNGDVVPGRANGCPLRRAFDDIDPAGAMKQLGLEKGKKVLLITGASSGAANINDALCRLLERLDLFAGDWQVVHLAGLRQFEQIEREYVSAKIGHKVLAYYDDMASLLAAADLVIGRSGAVSIAEYAATSVPSICLPYPYHKDRHQYLNAGKLVEAGAAVIVDDVEDPAERAERLWRELEGLMKNETRLKEMTENCSEIANVNAASSIGRRLLEIYKA